MVSSIIPSIDAGSQNKNSVVERYKRGLKPVVERKVVSEFPKNLNYMYHEYLENNKLRSPLRYVYTDNKLSYRSSPRTIPQTALGKIAQPDVVL